MQLQIVVKPYIRKFLLSELGEDYKLSQEDVYGRYLFELLRSPRSSRRHDNYLSRYTKKFAVQVESYQVSDRACKNCSSLTVILFNNHCEGFFYKYFQQFVQVRVEEEIMQAKQAIELFMFRNRLSEDDVQFETLKRNWNRYWKNEKIRLENLKSPTTLSLAA